MTFYEKLNTRIEKVHSLVCVGLDNADPEFNRRIIDQTHEYACAYKPNLAFYETVGWDALKKTITYLQQNHPDIVTIADAKRADIGNTNEQYVHSIFDELGFNAVTLHPYLGKEALKPFLDRQDKGCIILCRTSNPGAGEFQDLLIDQKPLWYHVAQNVRNSWNHNSNCSLVVGATYPNELKQIRQIVGNMPLLVPGIGAQGGDIQATVTAGLDSQGRGMIINSSRGIIFADNPKEAAKELCNQINQYR